MHIALATLEYPTELYRAGGMCWAFAKIAEGLKMRGHEITVVVPSGCDETIKDSAGVTVRRYRENPRLPSRLTRALSWRLPGSPGHYDRSWSLYDALDTLNRDKPIDLVLGAVSTELFFTAKSHRWPVVCRVSSYRMLIVISNFFPVTAAYMFEDWMRLEASAAANARYAPSKLLSTIFKELGCGNTLVIHTPLTRNTSPADLTGRPSGAGFMPQRFILFFGSLQGTKGVHILADALVSVLENHADLHVVFIGRDLSAPGFGSMKAYITTKLSAYAGQVHILGVLDQSEAMKYVARAEWIVFPSVMDNLPNTLLEAMSLSRPVLVTRNSGTDEIVEDGISGIVVESNSREALRAGLEHALEMDSSKRAELGEQARRAVIRYCDPDVSVRELDSLLVAIHDENRGMMRRVGFHAGARLLFARIAWISRAFYYCWLGIPDKAVVRLKHMCAKYIPGLPVVGL